MTTQSGQSLVELLVVVAILGAALGVTSVYLTPMEAPLQAGSALMESFFREARMRAISSTCAYRVTPDGTGRLRAETASSCLDTTWTADGAMRLDMPHGVTMSPESWKVCFSSRGISTDNVVVTLAHEDDDPLRVEVLVGGTTRVY